MGARYRLVSIDLCPFVQRSVIALHEKGVPFELETVDLAEKPGWFSALSPRGKVPLLVIDDGEALFESAVINEYLDEVAGGPTLLPEEPLLRARSRMWIEFSSTTLLELWRASVAVDELAARQHGAVAAEQLRRLSAEVRGTYFLGSDPSLVDVAVAPALLRAQWMHQLAPELGLLPVGSSAQGYAARLLDRKSVKASISPGMKERFLAYLRGQRGPGREVSPGWFGRLAAGR